MSVLNQPIRIPEGELRWSFARSGGPGGQNVNKVASKAVVRWDLMGSSSIPDDLKPRLRARLGRRLTQEGVVIVSSQRFRDQDRNRRDCLNKLHELIQLAAARPKLRKPTGPTRSARAARAAAKRHRSALKKSRQIPRDE
jgi:ribosome-associated protein